MSLFFNEVEGCLSQISVYPACLLPDACQTWFVSLEFFCPRFEQVVVVGRRHCPVPYLVHPFVSEPRGWGCITLRVALSLSTFRSMDKWSSHHFVVLHTVVAPRLF